MKTKAMMVQNMAGSHQVRNLQSHQDKQIEQNMANAQQNLVFSELLNKQFMEHASFHKHISEKMNVQQIMKELNAGKQGLGAKEMSTDFFFDSLFKKRNQKEEAVTEGEIIDSDPNDMEFRKRNEGDSEEMLMDDHDTTDMEFEDHWGVERRGEWPQSSD